jgi:adenylate cyclase
LAEQIPLKDKVPGSRPGGGTMKNEIERKFLVKRLPDLSHIVPKRYERYFLDSKPRTEERIQKIDNNYFYEKKTDISQLERIRDKKKEITESEFNRLKQKARGPIVRERFDISSNPDISIQIYFGKLTGLRRAEVEFNSVEEAKVFKPLNWMGKEITNLPIARDGKLLDFNDADLERMIEKGF